MSLIHGMAALNLEMSDRVPRTEYSAEMSYDLIKATTGIALDENSTQQQITDARRAFYKAWNYDFMWSIVIKAKYLGKYYTDMGHAVFDQGGSDFREVGESVFEEPEDVLDFDPVESLPQYTEKELVELFDKDYDNRVAMSPDAVNMTGTYITAMSGLIDMLGWDMMLLAAGIDSNGFGKLMERYTDWMVPFFNALAKSKTPVVMAHDDIVWTSGAFLAPEWYRTYLFPMYKKLFDPVLQSGKKLIYTSDGNFTEFIDDIAKCNVHGFVMEPTTDMQYIADKYGKTHSFVGNADTRILLNGTKDDIYNEVKRCMDIGKKYPGFIMAVGNHIPANTPLDNALWYNECYEKLSKR